MSLEWARARLLQHCEELRKLREAHAAAHVRQSPARTPAAAVIVLRPDTQQRESPGSAETGTVLKFGQRGRRRA